MLVLACAKPSPPRSKVTPNDIKRAVQDAHAACLESKAAPQCRIMWDRVSDLTHAFARQKDLEAEQKLENAIKYWIEKDEEIGLREYDL